MKRIIFSLFAIALLSLHLYSCNSTKSSNLNLAELSSILADTTVRPFNGVLLIENENSSIPIDAGFSDFDKNTPLEFTDQFSIGSLSKQVTAVLVLKAKDDGLLNLQEQVGKYIKDFPFEITIHHLLSHTHGIKSLDEALDFEPGTQFAYSNVGYELLGQILEKVRGQSFAQLTEELFEKCEMKDSYSPDLPKGRKVVQGYTRSETGQVVKEAETFEAYEVPAALLISTANDLLIWNKMLHEGGLLSKKSYEQMITPYMIQDHSLMGKVAYGYALRISEENGVKAIGHTGYVPGFISMNYYYPETKTSLIMLENLDWNHESIKNTFCFEMGVKGLVEIGMK